MIAVGIAGTANRGNVSRGKGRKSSVLAVAIEVRSLALKGEAIHEAYFKSKLGYLLGEVGPGWMTVVFKLLNEKNVDDLIRFEKECPITF